MHGFASQRREEFAECGYFADRAIGLPVHRSKVLDQVGGSTSASRSRQLEDDDFCSRASLRAIDLRVQRRVHPHFGSRSFAANNVDYRSDGDELAQVRGEVGYRRRSRKRIHRSRRYTRGFDRRKHFVPIGPPRTSGNRRSGRRTCRRLAAGEQLASRSLPVAEEEEWQRIAGVRRTFCEAFRGDRALLAIRAFGEASAQTLGSRIERIFRRCRSTRRDLPTSS